MPKAPLDPSDPFVVRIEGESVTIPQRIYNPEPTDANALTEVQRCIFHCVYSRHHDGFVRQAHARDLLHCREPSAAPFVVRLIGEYVLPIVVDISAALADNPAEFEALRRFAPENPGFMELNRQRAISYWSGYYRLEFPDVAEYPGLAMIAALCAPPPT